MISLRGPNDSNKNQASKRGIFSANAYTLHTNKFFLVD